MPALVALTACVLAGLGATWFLYRHRLPRERRHAGYAMLSALGQGDFMQLVLAVLNRRGYERAFGGSGTEGEYLLERRGQPWLLSSRHSSAYTPGSTGIAEFANHLRQRGIQGGLLAIPGRFPRNAPALARAHRVELLDGAGMWDELQPLLDETQHAAIDRPALARLRWQFVLAWLAAVAIGVAVYLGMVRAAAEAPVQTPATVPAQAPAPAAATPAEAAPAMQAPDTSPAPAPPAAVEPAATATATAPAPVATAASDTSDAALAARRKAIAAAVAALPHVRNATWPAPSTLQVVVDSELFDPRARICPLIEPDPDLGASRLQVQYPASATRPVRFLQCRAY
jgi:hypothetical protein